MDTVKRTIEIGDGKVNFKMCVPIDAIILNDYTRNCYSNMVSPDITNTRCLEIMTDMLKIIEGQGSEVAVG